MSGNLLAPLTFDAAGIQRFVREQACALCAGHLLADFGPGLNEYIARCPNCEHVIMAHNHVNINAAEAVRRNVYTGLRELADDEPAKSPEDIINELGG